MRNKHHYIIGLPKYKCFLYHSSDHHSETTKSTKSTHRSFLGQRGPSKRQAPGTSLPMKALISVVTEYEARPTAMHLKSKMSYKSKE